MRGGNGELQGTLHICLLHTLKLLHGYCRRSVAPAGTTHGYGTQQADGTAYLVPIRLVNPSSVPSILAREAGGTRSPASHGFLDERCSDQGTCDRPTTFRWEKPVAQSRLPKVSTCLHTHSTKVICTRVARHLPIRHRTGGLIGRQRLGVACKWVIVDFVRRKGRLAVLIFTLI